MNKGNYLGVFCLVGFMGIVLFLSGDPFMLMNLQAAMVIILGTAGAYFLVDQPQQSLSTQLHAAGQGAWLAGVITFIISILLVLANLDVPQKIGPHLYLGLISLLYGTIILLLCKLASLRLLKDGQHPLLHS